MRMHRVLPEEGPRHTRHSRDVGASGWSKDPCPNSASPPSSHRPSLWRRPHGSASGRGHLLRPPPLLAPLARPCMPRSRLHLAPCSLAPCSLAPCALSPCALSPCARSPCSAPQARWSASSTRGGRAPTGCARRTRGTSSSSPMRRTSRSGTRQTARVCACAQLVQTWAGPRRGRERDRGWRLGGVAAG